VSWLEFLVPALVLMTGLPCTAIAYVYSQNSHSAWRGRLFAFFAASVGVSFLMAVGIFIRRSGLVGGFLPYFIVWNLSFALLATASYQALGVALIASGIDFTKRFLLPFVAATVLAYASNTFLALKGGSDLFFPYIEGAYSATSIYLFAALAAALLVLLRNRSRLAPEDGKTLERFLYVFLPLGTLLFLDELFRVTRWIEIPLLPLLPLSPLVLYCFSSLELLARMRRERGSRLPLPADSRLDEMSASIAVSCGASPLTQRERSILVDLLGGLSNAEIGSKRGISPHTVKNHVYSIYQKTGAGSRKELYAFALRGDRASSGSLDPAGR
jgi:DNA-binding CsgD family transcriptional regulator